MAAIDISQDDLSSFHASHFSAVSVNHFSQHFLGPVEDEFTAEEEDNDGLGYYADGGKRTLTDEQIAIFRHSEIETLLRERRHAIEAKDSSDQSALASMAEDGEIDEGEMKDTPSPAIIGPVLPPSNANTQKLSNKKRKKEKKRQIAVQKGYFKQNIKPDLRKRTWDKVETGLNDLQYDDMDTGANTGPSMGAQRRKISYDD
ncbi:hypothetical protein HYFRA_00003260 [Hymenoscyphus fraxineus]|uniref:Uncharacterized protein n=1 Tax=Hymenoscyphus fraxineus TaxID=746836 RepID=A0A9N9KS06_9HELO|nr:hypothetical protein HYFRA_00003260 [Hymenoscyphus fraxineus]